MARSAGWFNALEDCAEVAFADAWERELGRGKGELEGVREYLRLQTWSPGQSLRVLHVLGKEPEVWKAEAVSEKEYTSRGKKICILGLFSVGCLVLGILMLENSNLGDIDSILVFF